MSRNTILISVILTVIILCALAFFLIIYFLLYNNKLKKAVKEGKADRPMPAISVYAMMFLCMVFLAAAVFSVSGIVELGQRLDKLTGLETEQKEKLDEIIDKELMTYDLIWDTKEEITAGSMIDYTEFTYGGYHSEDHSIDVTIKTVPKVSAVKDGVIFYFEGQAVPLTLNSSGVYTGTFRADIFNSRIEGLLTVETEKVTLSEIVLDRQHDMSKALISTAADYIPSFFFNTNSNDTDNNSGAEALPKEITDTEKHTLQYRNDYRLVITYPAKNSSFEIDTVKTVTRFNGRTIDEQDITQSCRKGTNDENGDAFIPSVKIAQKLENVTDNDYVEILISVTDKDGYSYQLPLYTHGSRPIHGGLQDSRGNMIYIYDKDGNKLTGPVVE